MPISDIPTVNSLRNVLTYLERCGVQIPEFVNRAINDAIVRVEATHWPAALDQRGQNIEAQLREEVTSMMEDILKMVDIIGAKDEEITELYNQVGQQQELLNEQAHFIKYIEIRCERYFSQRPEEFADRYMRWAEAQTARIEQRENK